MSLNRVLKVSFAVTFFASLAFAQSNQTISGVVDSIDKTDVNNPVAKVRTATSNLKISLSSLSPFARAKVEASVNKNKVVSFTASPASIVAKSEMPMGIRPDCSALPIKIEELNEMGGSSKVKDQIDFLKEIPPGTLQAFTLVYDTQSLQRNDKNKENPGVSPKWPRVIRSSADGKINLSYVCDPSNPMYDTVETIYFDDKTNAFKTVEYDFRKTAGLGTSRVHENPASCVSCHTADVAAKNPSLKPIWQEYFFWSDCKHGRGTSVYGSSDDNMGPSTFRSRPYKNAPEGCNEKADVEHHDEEKKNFADFKTVQKDNPCYGLLPWPKIPEGKENEIPYVNYKNYPYANSAQDKTRNGKMDYSLRTNLRYNDTLGHLNAMRLQQLLKNTNSEYNVAKYYLLEDELGCFTDQDRKDLKSLIPDLTFGPNSANYEDHDSPKSHSLLYAFSKRAGIKDGDWSMELKATNSSYSANFPNSQSGFGDLMMADVVEGNILADLQKENPAIAAGSKNGITRGVEEYFGSDFSCIDDLGGGIAGNLKGGFYSGGSEDKPKFCKILHDENAKNLKHLKDTHQCPADSPTPKNATDLLEKVKNASVAIDQASVKRGHELVEGAANCISCHSPTEQNKNNMPKNLLFMPSSKLDVEANGSALANLKSKFLEDPDLVENEVKSGAMPFGRKKSDFTDDQRSDIVNYLKSLSSGATKAN